LVIVISIEGIAVIEESQAVLVE